MFGRALGNNREPKPHYFANIGLPSEERAFIANFGGFPYEESWRVFHTKKGIDARWNGDHKTADDALAALQNEY